MVAKSKLLSSGLPEWGLEAVGKSCAVWGKKSYFRYSWGRVERPKGPSSGGERENQQRWPMTEATILPSVTGVLNNLQ